MLLGISRENETALRNWEDLEIGGKITENYYPWFIKKYGVSKSQKYRLIDHQSINNFLLVSVQNYVKVAVFTTRMWIYNRRPEGILNDTHQYSTTSSIIMNIKGTVGALKTRN